MSVRRRRHKHNNSARAVFAFSVSPPPLRGYGGCGVAGAPTKTPLAAALSVSRWGLINILCEAAPTRRRENAECARIGAIFTLALCVYPRDLHIFPPI